MFPDLLCDDVFRLETSRLWLRWPRAADAAQVASLAGDQDVAIKTARIPHPYPEGKAAEFILLSRSANAHGQALTLAITKKRRPNELIGCIGLEPDGDGRLEVGYWLGKRYWGRGLVTEAVQGVVDLTFRHTEVGELRASALPANPASRRVLEKAGFQPAGKRTIEAPARGGPLTTDLFRLTRDAWLDRSLALERRAAQPGLSTAPNM